MSSCPICTDEYSIRSPGKVQQCCSSVLCQDCLYSHIKSVLEEGVTGDGRKNLSCPFGCGEDVPDRTVRESFQTKHPNFPRLLIGRPLYNISSWLGIIHPMFRERAAIYFWRFSQSLAERNDLQLYEKWSLSMALSHKINHDTHSSMSDETDKKGEKEEMQDASHVYTHVIHCPRPDCECLWLTNVPYRKKKLAHERQYNKEKRHDEAPKSFTKSLILSCSAALFFKPIPPEKEESMMNENGYTTAHWMNPIDIDVFNIIKVEKKMHTGSRNVLHTGRSKSARDETNKDGRIVSCPTCHHQFCGLCSRPWSTLSNSSGIRVTHTGRLCSIYGQRASNDDDFLQAADAGDARFCPGCSMRTNRIDGCNHSKSGVGMLEQLFVVQFLQKSCIMSNWLNLI